MEDFEASRAPLQPPAAEPAERVTASEALTYVGVAVVMAGVLFGLFTGVSGDAIVLILVLGVAAVGLAALLAAGAAYTTAMTTGWVIGHEAATRSGWAPVIAGAFLRGISGLPSSSAAVATLRFTGMAGSAGILLVLGQMPEADTGMLILLATLISLLAMWWAVRLGANELAVAGGIGIFGVALDVTARTLGRSAGAPIVLILSGLLLVACAALVQQAIKH